MVLSMILSDKKKCFASHRKELLIEAKSSKQWQKIAALTNREVQVILNNLVLVLVDKSELY